MTEVLSAQDFRRLFQERSPKLLLCFDIFLEPTLQSLVAGAVADSPLSLHLWNCESFPDAKKTIGVYGRTPALVAIDQSDVVDMLCSPDLTVERVKSFCDRFRDYIRPSVVDGATQPRCSVVTVTTSNVAIDLRRMVNMGIDLMQKGDGFYAEKFFTKALGVLDAVDRKDDDNISGSVAVVLAWLVISLISQAKCASSHVDRLVEHRDNWATAHSDVQRALCLYTLVSAMPSSTWNPHSCSKKALSSLLLKDPENFQARCALVITYFLTGDMELCVTEALKLHVLGNDFGRVALRELRTFLGEDDVLLRDQKWIRSV